MSNLENWDKLARPPVDALKQIKGGRLSGMTDINPQWRYKAMTEVYGQCGQGWNYEIVRTWTESGPDGQVCAFAQVNLFVGQRAPIPGIGGSMLVAKESSGLRTNDEAYKMAITDALSVAMKMLGVGADIYMGRWDGSKYKDGEADAAAGVFNALDKETQEWLRNGAMEVIAQLAKGDAEGAHITIERMEMDADLYAAFWSQLDSKQRSTLKAYGEIIRADSLDRLKEAWDKAPKHAHLILDKVKDARKGELMEAAA